MTIPLALAMLTAVPWQATVQRDGCDIVATGRATAFGPGLYGRHCATGITLKRKTFGCALPRGRCAATRPSPLGSVPDYTLVRIWCPETRRLAVVPVVDEGPAQHGPGSAMIDLTLPVCKKLDYKWRRNPRVRIRVLAGTAAAGKALMEVQNE